MIEVGKLVFTKTSGEVGYVLLLSGSPDLVALASESREVADGWRGATVAVARFPVITGDGTVRHEIRHFFVDELETLEERVARDRAERRLLQQLAAGDAGTLLRDDKKSVN